MSEHVRGKGGQGTNEFEAVEEDEEDLHFEIVSLFRDVQFW